MAPAAGPRSDAGRLFGWFTRPFEWIWGSIVIDDVARMVFAISCVTIRTQFSDPCSGSPTPPSAEARNLEVEIQSGRFASDWFLDHVGTPLGSGAYAGRYEERFPTGATRLAQLAGCDNVRGKSAVCRCRSRDEGCGWTLRPRRSRRRSGVRYSETLVDADKTAPFMGTAARRIG
jgi:hypothetical protein